LINEREILREFCFVGGGLVVRVMMSTVVERGGGDGG
jgi:hypothetical protein